jgi:membrane-associated protein
MEDFILSYGLVALAGIFLLDDLGIPIPSGSILFSAGILAKKFPENFPLLSLWIIATIIPLIGNSILFYLGKHGARIWLQNHGHKIFLPQYRLKNAENFARKYGEKAVFFAAIISSVRAVSSVLAGSFSMPYKKFISYHIPGIIIWSTTLIFTGYFLGNKIWEYLQIYKHQGFIILGIILFIYILTKHKFFKKLTKFSPELNSKK